jgi:hypothetical protein
MHPLSMMFSMPTRKAIFAVAVLLAMFAIASFAHAVDGPLLRLYDTAPVSPQNPVIASVKECGIEIPVGEFCGYMNMWVPAEKKHGVLTKEEKLRYLQQLLDNHFLLWDGYQKQLDKTPELIEQLDYTLNLDLEEALVHREFDKQAPRTDKEKDEIISALQDRIFKAAKIRIFNDAYNQLKEIVKATGSESDLLQKLTAKQQSVPLAGYGGGTLSIGAYLECYLAMPPKERPDIETNDGFLKVLQQALIVPLMCAEGGRQHLESSEWVKNNILLNRNTLVRMAMLASLAAEARSQTKEPGGEERLKRWYEEHRQDRYTTRDHDGKEITLAFEENKQAILNDYQEDLAARLQKEVIQSLRKDRTISIDEKILGQLNPVMK